MSFFTGRPEVSIWQRMPWAGLVIAGALVMLPLGWVTYALLVFVPGFALLSLARREATVAELVGVSASLSVLLLPLAILLSSVVSIRASGLIIGGFVAAVGAYGLLSRPDFRVDFHDWPILALALPVFIIVLAVIARTFVITPDGLCCATTHASDLNFHLSIAQRFIAAPSLPPEDPYLPGYPIVYNWFMHVTMGGLTLFAGIGLFDSFKVLVALVAALIFVDACLLARSLFPDARSSLLAGLLYVSGSGLSWVYMLYEGLRGQEVDLFKVAIYEWNGVMGLKYDSPSLYFFLPQTQTFGLLAMICGLFLYTLAIRERSVRTSLLAGIVLASLVLYHTITAFPVLVAVSLTLAYLVYRERLTLLCGESARLLVAAAIPVAAGAVAGLYQLTILSASAGQQVVPGYQGDFPQTILVALGPLLPFALYGMYLCRDRLAAVPLIIFTGVNLLFVNALEMPATWNTYRFLVYLGLPISLFAGLGLARWLSAGRMWKAVVAIVVILAMLPSTAAIILFYTDSSYVHATPGDVEALQWVGSHTPTNAIFFEEPTHFVRLPVMTGRDVAYAGCVYTWQYHNVDRQNEMESILHVDDRDALYQEMASHHVDYVFVGSKESGYPFAVAMEGNPRFQPVYNRDGVKIYKVSPP